MSLINQEQATSGYRLINQAVNYDFSNQLSFRLAVDNITNKEYQNHLGGYNRVKMSEIPTMDRLPSQERTGWAEMTYSF